MTNSDSEADHTEAVLLGITDVEKSHIPDVTTTHDDEDEELKVDEEDDEVEIEEIEVDEPDVEN